MYWPAFVAEPEQPFEPPETVFGDFVSFKRWLLASSTMEKKHNDGQSWSSFHQLKQDGKEGVEPYSFILPSKELLLSVPLLLIVWKTAQADPNW